MLLNDRLEIQDLLYTAQFAGAVSLEAPTVGIQVCAYIQMYYITPIYER